MARVIDELYIRVESFEKNAKGNRYIANTFEKTSEISCYRSFSCRSILLSTNAILGIY